MQYFSEKLNTISNVSDDMQKMKDFLSKTISSAVLECANSGDTAAMEELRDSIPSWHHSKEAVADMAAEMRSAEELQVSERENAARNFSESKFRAGLQCLVFDIMSMTSGSRNSSPVDEEIVKMLVAQVPKDRYLDFIYEMTTKFTRALASEKRSVSSSKRMEIIGRIKELSRIAEAL